MNGGGEWTLEVEGNNGEVRVVCLFRNLRDIGYTKR